jgi:hypothetical protein
MPTKVGSEREGLLGPLVDQELLRTTFRRRRDEFVYKKVASEEERSHLDDGWVVHKPTRSHTWMKKAKSVETRLEDRVWCLFFQMGYPVAWLEKLNEIRRVSAHKSPYRQYSEEDLEFVSFIKAALFDRFTAAGFEV